jgi:hypothetical protein
MCRLARLDLRRTPEVDDRSVPALPSTTYPPHSGMYPYAAPAQDSIEANRAQWSVTRGNLALHAPERLLHDLIAGARRRFEPF